MFDSEIVADRAKVFDVVQGLVPSADAFLKKCHIYCRQLGSPPRSSLGGVL